MKNKLLKGVGIIVAILIAFFVYQSVNDQLAFDRLDRGGDPQSARQYIAYTKDLEARYKNDNYGSTTPEGTLSLFVEALKKKDVTLAANYFVPEKRVKMAEDLAAGLKSGGVEMLLGDLNKEKIKYELDSERVRFETYDENNIAEFSFDFFKNKFNQKWLIEDL